MTDVNLGIDQLTETQQAALGTYTAVTNQESVAAIPLLQRSEWNVQVFTSNVRYPSVALT